MDSKVISYINFSKKKKLNNFFTKYLMISPFNNRWLIGPSQVSCRTPNGPRWDLVKSARFKCYIVRDILIIQ